MAEAKSEMGKGLFRSHIKGETCSGGEGRDGKRD